MAGRKSDECVKLIIHVRIKSHASEDKLSSLIPDFLKISETRLYGVLL